MSKKFPRLRQDHSKTMPIDLTERQEDIILVLLKMISTTKNSNKLLGKLGVSNEELDSIGVAIIEARKMKQRLDQYR